MTIFASSPVQDVTFGQALNISLNNYYDLLKEQVGSLKSEERLQLKLVADTIDLSEEKKASQGGYEWFSYYNLLNRSDKGIQPVPVAGEIQVSLAQLSSVYGSFLRKLRSYAVMKVLSDQEQNRVKEIDLQIDTIKDDALNLYLLDREKWARVAPAMGYSVGDNDAYVQWSGQYGHIRMIEKKNSEIRNLQFEQQTILAKQYPDADDQDIVAADTDYHNPLMRLRYPVWPDYKYKNGDEFSPSYLAMLPLGSTALFDDRYVATFDKTLTTIKGAGSGNFIGEFSKTTSESSSITTDWSGSGSGGYAFIRVSASVSDHTKIQSDFSKATTIKLGADSATRINIAFPSWFNPTLFEHRHVKENPHEFEEFFGKQGSLLFYPTALIVIRGFSVEFSSSQDWSYDYEHRFSASGGGGFSAFGIPFGASADYSSSVKEHQVDQSKTSLKFKDDKDTIRFVGYAVKKNTVFEKAVSVKLAKLFG
ncbi:hypothetical protein [Rugamonas rivuli]|uniref:Uncharacterized protein n=1 Tax=Rugamonas rivuli TaxID=2743358 RepID=A0A843SLR0_9BURK|nr:hypothetical protein [Rugamonas rivuli]MQA22844.1 hypothetical protein [Rugamonas rivuli]